MPLFKRSYFFQHRRLAILLPIRPPLLRLFLGSLAATPTLIMMLQT